MSAREKRHSHTLSLEVENETTFLEGNLASLHFRSVYLAFDSFQETYLKTHSFNFV